MAAKRITNKLGKDDPVPGFASSDRQHIQNSEVAAAFRQRDAIQFEMEAKCRENANLSASLTKSAERIQELEEILSRYMTAGNHQSSEIKELRGQVELLESGRSQLSIRLEESIHREQARAMENTSLSGKIPQWKDQVRRLNEIVRARETQLEVVEGAEETLVHQVTELELKIEALEKESCWARLLRRLNFQWPKW